MHTVTVILEAKAGCENQLKSALQTVAEKSRLEPSCIGYTVCQDSKDPRQFSLFEKWKSSKEHAQQFTKDYILDFAAQAESLLDKPYSVVMGTEV